MLLHKFYPDNIELLSDKYKFLYKLYKEGNYWVILNTRNCFGPFPSPEVPWDISNVEKLCLRKDVSKVIQWINSNIIIRLPELNYVTIGVLIRIATSMLNKCNIPKEVNIMFHENLVVNVRKEYNKLINEQLPFQGFLQ